MLKNYFFIKKLADKCNELFINEQITDCFAMGKERLTICGEHRQLFIHFHRDYPFFIVEDMRERPPGGQPYFQSLIGERIRSFEIQSNARQLLLKTESKKLIFNLYHGSQGAVLLDHDEYFLNNCTIMHDEINLEKAIKLSGFNKADINEGMKSERFYVHENDGLMSFSICPFHENEVDYLWDNYQHAFYRCLGMIRYESLKQQILPPLDKQISYVEKTLSKIKDTHVDEQEKAHLEHKGHLILNNLHQIEKGQTSLEVLNYFDPEQNDVSIALNPKLSPQKNAERYYAKAKSYDQNRKTLEIRKKNYSDRLKNLYTYKSEFESLNHSKDLEKFKKKLIREGILNHEKGDARKQTMSQNQRNLIEFTIDDQTVIVGKDAKTNDYISIKLSKANDIWFHVQGSPGSHVILRWHDQKDNPPKELLSKVASLAAYYSKQKNAGTVPVIYTQAKYVRKPKGAAAGAVTVSKEKSIFVKPMAYEEIV